MPPATKTFFIDLVSNDSVTVFETSAIVHNVLYSNSGGGPRYMDGKDIDGNLLFKMGASVGESSGLEATWLAPNGLVLHPIDYTSISVTVIYSEEG